MAYTATDFAKDLALYTTGAVIGVTRSRKFAAYAAKKGIQLAGIGARQAVVPAARGALALGTGLVRRNPYVATAIGLGAAQQAGAFSAQEQYIEDEINRRMMQAEQTFDTAQAITQRPNFSNEVVAVAKRKASKYNKAIKAGMKAVKSSTSNGAKGKIKVPKVAFKAVSKVASAVNRGKKVSSKGLTGTIKRAVSGVLGKKPVRRKRAPSKGSYTITVGKR
tara:strand:- start:846 stop:1508 length:663 start_codon:yes stop_codon:yes gene_type:complete